MKTRLTSLNALPLQITSHPAFPLLAGFIAFALYLALAWLFLEPEAVWSPDEGAKLLQLKSLRFEGGLLRTDIVYTSQGLDPEFKYALINPQQDLLAVQGDALVLPRLPIFTLLVWPFYSLGGMPGLYVLPALAGGLAVWLALALLPPGQRRLSMWLLIALGCPLIIYSALFWEHSLAAALSMAATWLLLNGVGDMGHAHRWPWWVLAGGLFALSAYLRLEAVNFTLAILVAAFWLSPTTRRGLVLAGVVYAWLLLPYPFLHQDLFQNQALPLNARHLNLPLAYLSQAGWAAIPDLLIGPYTDESINPGWMGLIWTGAAVVALSLSWLAHYNPRLQPWAWTCLLLSALPSGYFLFTPIPYRSAHGLLFTTPWMLLGLSRLPALWQQKIPRLRILVFAVLLGLLEYTLVMLVFRASSPHGGLEWGARFALLFYPLLALLTGWDLGDHQRANAILLAIFVMLGIGFQMRGLATIRHDKRINHQLNQTILRAPEVQILSDLWWLSLNAAPIYPQKAFFLAARPDEMAAWLEQAGAQQFHSFLFVTLDPALPGKVARSLKQYDLMIVESRSVENLLCIRVYLGP